MPQLLEVIGPKSGAAPLRYTVTELGTVDPMSIFAHFDGTAASGSWRPVVTVRAQNGTILSRTGPEVTLATGDTADVTYAPFLRGAAASTGGSGIQFDTSPQQGGYLEVETTGLGPGGIGPGINLAATNAAMQLTTTGVGNDMSLGSGASLNLLGTTDFAIDSLKHMAIRVGISGTGSRGILVIQAHESIKLEAPELTLNGFDAIYSTTTLFEMFVDGDNATFIISPGKVFRVLDYNGDPIFQVDEDGDLHGKTGKALTFDL